MPDGYGNQRRDWASPLVRRQIMPHITVQPVEGSEETTNRDTVVTRQRLWSRPFDLLPSDRIEFNGEVYTVVEVENYGTSESRGHTTAQLERVNDSAV